MMNFCSDKQQFSEAAHKQTRPEVIALINQKGGTGKTTTTLNLAVCLGLQHNQKVLCVDLDPQGNLTQGLIYAPPNTARTADRLLVVPQAKAQEYIVSARHNVDVIPNCFQPQLRETVDRLPLTPGLLRRQLGAAFSAYDYILIDTPAGLGASTRVGVEAADQIMIVISCGWYALKGTSAAVSWIGDIRRRASAPKSAIRVVINNYDDRRRFDREFRREVEYIFDEDLFQMRIRSSVRLAEAAARSLAIIEHDPTSGVAMDFTNLTREMLGLPQEETLLPGFESNDDAPAETAARLRLVS